MPVAHILSQGDELVSGQRTDTNATHLAARLTGLGFRVRGVSCSDDRLGELVEMIRGAVRGADLVVSTGGLGPTDDDLTAEAVAAVAGIPAAALPEASRTIPNPAGSAPGFALEIADALCVFLPGVPREMEAMVEQTLVPWLRERWTLSPPRRATFRVASAGESELQRRLDTLPPRDSRIHLGFRTFLYENHVKLTAPGADDPALERSFEETCAAVRAILGIDCYTEGRESLAEVVNGLLRRRGHTVTVAESCTGGLLGSWITSVSGSSDVFRQGWLTYADSAKEELLGVPAAMLAEHGAVSEPVARAMAEGARRGANADWALAITGVAGPTGGTPDKPVGTVFVSVAGPRGSRVRRMQFLHDRETNRQLSARTALEMLRRDLLRSAAA